MTHLSPATAGIVRGTNTLSRRHVKASCYLPCVPWTDCDLKYLSLRSQSRLPGRIFNARWCRFLARHVTGCLNFFESPPLYTKKQSVTSARSNSLLLKPDNGGDLRMLHLRRHLGKKVLGLTFTAIFKKERNKDVGKRCSLHLSNNNCTLKVTACKKKKKVS